VAAGPGWIVMGVLKMLAGSFLLFLALQEMVPLDVAGQPMQMYLVAFNHVFPSPGWALVVAAIFVIVSQLKINVTNAYAGSLAWSNFFARLTHSHPGRVVWLGFNVLIALLLMELGVFKALERILALYSNVAVAWIGAVVADLVINKPLGLSPAGIEFKRAHLYDVNPVGVGAMGVASLASLSAYAGVFGPLAQALSPFVAFGAAFIAAPLIAWTTGGRYYLARAAQVPKTKRGSLRCVVCEHRFETEDMAQCPAYGGWICSLCCSLDARCLDSCKPRARLRDQLLDVLQRWLPMPWVRALDSRLGHYLGVFSLSVALIGVTLALLYFQQSIDGTSPAIESLLWKVFVVLALIAGVASWLFILAQESRQVAQQESTRQMQLLTREIEAHKRTDAKLKEAKNAAETANLAKSRFVTGLSHELRTPLNAILGYAQLLEQQQLDPERRLPVFAQDAAKVIRRSGEHLSELIDGLLDIAKIEAGKVHLHRDVLNLPSLIDELTMMFAPQAQAKGIGFALERPPVIPAYVQTDGKRLRQILINLLTNAIKFTESGQVTFRLRYQRQTAEFDIIDTGPGIAQNELERIFAPFERGRRAAASDTPGMGLGLTISRVLTSIMGGELTVRSQVGQGSTFTVRMVLSEVSAPARGLAVEAQHVLGYEGPRRRLLIADDDADSLGLLRHVLQPLGFDLLEATRGDDALELALHQQPDLVLLDISMPGLSGWEVAKLLRDRGLQELPVVMVSADAFENRRVQSQSASGAPDHGNETFHNDFLVKPINLQQLLEVLRRHLHLRWVLSAAASTPRTDPAASLVDFHHNDPAPRASFPTETLDELEHLVSIGHVRGLLDRLGQLDGPSQNDPASAAVVHTLREHVRGFRLGEFRRALDGLRRA
jgi:signal transduction histidine kinase/CheY-like chemotaxis protein